jgi:hypothetical protein
MANNTNVQVAGQPALTFKDKICKKHDAHLHELFKVVRTMWTNWKLTRIFRTDNLDHSRVIGALDLNNNPMWEKIGRKSPFEIVREKMKESNCHVSCKRETFPGFTVYTLSAVEFDQTKVEPETHQETTDEKFARGCRMHDAMKHELETCVMEMCRVMRESNSPVTWQISSDCDKNSRVVGAVDRRNKKTWEYIGRKSPFDIIFSKMKKDHKCFVSSHFVGSVPFGDRIITTFAITVQEYQPKVVENDDNAEPNVAEAEQTEDEPNVAEAEQTDADQ